MCSNMLKIAPLNTLGKIFYYFFLFMKNAYASICNFFTGQNAHVVKKVCPNWKAFKYQIEKEQI